MDYDLKAENLPTIARNDRLHFFKYMNETTAKIVLNGCTMRWSTASFLNDPFDMQFEMDLQVNVKELKTAALSKSWQMVTGQSEIVAATPTGTMLERMRVEKPRITEALFRSVMSDAIDEVFGRMVEMLPSTNADLSPFHAKTKILSLSERADIPTMWSHYANAHKGVVLRFKSGGNAPYMMAVPMTYVDEVPAFLSSSELIDFFCGTHRIDVKDLANKMTYTKSSHWSYEKEWRIASGFGRAEDDPFEDVHFGLNELDGIIFGLNTTDSTKEVIRLLAQKCSSVQFFQVFRSASSFALQIEPAR